MHYRIYLLDMAGHITSARDLEAASDEAAIASVEEIDRTGCAIELWCGSRKVKAWMPEKS